MWQLIFIYSAKEIFLHTRFRQGQTKIFLLQHFDNIKGNIKIDCKLWVMGRPSATSGSIDPAHMRSGLSLHWLTVPSQGPLLRVTSENRDMKQNRRIRSFNQSKDTLTRSPRKQRTDLHTHLPEMNLWILHTLWNNWLK